MTAFRLRFTGVRLTCATSRAVECAGDMKARPRDMRGHGGGDHDSTRCGRRARDRPRVRRRTAARARCPRGAGPASAPASAGKGFMTTASVTTMRPLARSGVSDAGLSPSRSIAVPRRPRARRACNRCRRTVRSRECPRRADRPRGPRRARLLETIANSKPRRGSKDLTRSKYFCERRLFLGEGLRTFDSRLGSFANVDLPDPNP